MVLKVKDLLEQGFTAQEMIKMAEDAINTEIEAAQKKRASELQLRKNVLESIMTYLIAIGKVNPQDIKPNEIDELSKLVTNEDIVRVGGYLGLFKTQKNTKDADTAAIESFLKNLSN